MKNYTSCFLGIPLPQEYVREFGQLLRDIHVIDPTIELVQSGTPHITIYYLNKQSQNSLEEIYKATEPFTKSLSEISITVGTLGYFTEDIPKVLFLGVAYPETLTRYKNNISDVLKKYSAPDNNLPFRPHMTVGRIKSTEAQESFKAKEKELALLLNAIHWNFNVNEIALYGVDSTKSPEHQEILATIPLG